jgi:hypothetical protein
VVEPVNALPIEKKHILGNRLPPLTPLSFLVSALFKVPSCCISRVPIGLDVQTLVGLGVKLGESFVGHFAASDASSNLELKSYPGTPSIISRAPGIIHDHMSN